MTGRESRPILFRVRDDNNSIRLPDGRRLAFAEHGEDENPVVLLCYGTPSSRLVEPFHADLADELGFRLIVPDRPGFGLSDPQPGRTLRDWPADAAHLLGEIGARTACVAGSSGGGPYALACAALLGPRVVPAVALHAPAPPRDAPEHGFVPSDPEELSRRGTAFAQALDADPDTFFAMVEPSLSAADRVRWREADTRSAALTMFREAFRQGVDAYVEDHLINSGLWQDLLPLVSQPVRLWQGDDDNNVPPSATTYLAGQLPDGELTMLPGAGHLFGAGQWRTIYQELLKAAAE